MEGKPINRRIKAGVTVQNSSRGCDSVTVLSTLACEAVDARL
jgi:hypothetical protein